MNKIEKKRINDLFKISRCLTNLKIHHVIFDGALLGFIRENNLIKWDWDAEISMRYSEYKKNLIKIIETIDKLQIGSIKLNNSFENPKLTINQDDFKYTLQPFHYSKDKKIIFRRLYKYPAKYLDEISKFKINGYVFPIPKNPEDLLELEYGKNWRTPLNSKVKDEYLSSQVYTIKNNKLFAEIFKYSEIIKSILRNLIILPRKLLSKYPIIEYYLNLNKEQLFIDQLNFVCSKKSKVIFIEIGSSDLKEAIILSQINQNINFTCKVFEASRATYQKLLRIRNSHGIQNLKIFNKAIVPSKLNYFLEINKKNPNLNKMISSEKPLKNKSNNILLSNINDLKIDGFHKLVKMDIEGLEEELFLENISFIKKLTDISFTIELHQSLYKKNLDLEKFLYELLDNGYKILFIELSMYCNPYFLNRLRNSKGIFKKACGRYLIKYPPIDCIKYIAFTEYRLIKYKPYFSSKNIRSITLIKSN